MKIKNWKKHQHFKDRKPPWIKLYREILDDIEWHELDAKSAKVLVMLWLIASENDGDLPSMKTLSFRLRMSEKDVISSCNSLQSWLVQDDVSAISSRYQSDSVETETETETETEKRQKATPVATRFDDFWKTWPKSERKQDKAKCAEKWKAQALDGITDLILADVETKKRTQKWQGGFIEAPEVYLNNRRWEDGVTPDTPGQTGFADPDSRAAIETEGIEKGIGPWNEGMEQWHIYKAKVRGNSAPVLNISQLSAMAARRSQ